MAIDWDTYRKIRQLFLVEGQSIRAISRQLNVSRKTVRKYCRGGVLPNARKIADRPAPLYRKVKSEIIRLLEENNTLPKKQRLNARNIWEYLQSEKGIAIAQSTVRRYVRELREHHPEVFLPLEHEPGEAMQFDWGDMSAVIAGDKITVSVFCAVLPHCGALCAFIYPDKSTLSFLHGHIQSFEFFGGVARHCIYDNLKTAVKKGSGKNAVKQTNFIRLEAHYGFEAVFCNVASGWEKSNVENAVAIVRRIAFTPMPRVDSFEELQNHITNRCLHYAQTHTISGHEQSIRDALEQERKTLFPLPDVRLDTGFTYTALVHPDLTVRHEGTRYSVPRHLVGKEVTLCLSPFHLTVFYKGREVFQHDRAMKKQDHRYVLEHYLEILDRKPRAVEQAIPLKRGIMPEECKEFLRLCREPEAKQQLVQILLLGSKVERAKLLWAIRQANNTRNPNLSLVKLYLELEEPGPQRNELEVRHKSLTAYDELLQEGAANHEPEPM
ncbi:IS21 family transposase [Desulfoscipio gibsoniae]|uniref:Transposase n=1 Tax=Desulfoscipio gibsoniae DSM 7213 TaxID=767817 RepID=R4KJ26_9FIRM|nr:IS21 family transposase [Desulfoscipio gibsoniae]AGL03223.1 transposase [Desulfoscipio gibsoniae DSM 7213]